MHVLFQLNDCRSAGFCACAPIAESALEIGVLLLGLMLASRPLLLIIMGGP
jgi:hypothetical protein